MEKGIDKLNLINISSLIWLIFSWTSVHEDIAYILIQAEYESLMETFNNC